MAANNKTTELLNADAKTDATVFQDIKTGLKQAIEHSKGNLEARETIVTLSTSNTDQK